MSISEWHNSWRTSLEVRLLILNDNPVSSALAVVFYVYVGKSIY